MTGPVLVGRSGELATIRALVDRAVAGDAGALLVSGDPGIGKTALVQEACAGLDPHVLVLFGAALPMTSMAVPFLAIRFAVRGVTGEGDALFGVSQSTSDIPFAFDSWLGEKSRERPVVVVVDDLQWADQSTLDVLMYVLAGPADRRLAVIATIRSSEVGDGHPLQHWLADIRRLPRIEQLSLGPLDRAGTDAQLTSLFGAPHQSLVEDVFTHTRGNPYLSRLVVAGLPPDARHLPDLLPPDLNSAVLQSWRRLSAPTRELTRLLAVGGRPLHANELDEVVGSPGSIRRDSSMLGEAVDAGLLDVGPDGAYWFRHPLSAEVLETGLPEEERQRVHSAFADFYERRLTVTPEPPVELLVALADHHDQAGHRSEAYRWTLRASEAVGQIGGAREMLRLLRRAVALRKEIPAATESQHDLLTKWRGAAADAGAHEEELQAIESLIDGLIPEEHPLTVAELLVRRMHLRFFTGRAFLDPEEMREAVRLASAAPPSWQLALALAELAHAEAWSDAPGMTEHAEQALTLARTAGNPRALSYALSANAVVAMHHEQAEGARAFAVEARGAAVLARDYLAFSRAVMSEANGLEAWSSRFYADLLRGHREELTALGAPHTYVAHLSANEAASWLSIGEWRECRRLLRVVLGSDPGPFADVSARLAAARLAAWQGRVAEAEAHLARADEIFAGSSAFLNFDFDACRAEVCLAAGKPEAAFAAAMTGATLPGVPPTMCEWLMPLAARAIADQVQLARDAGSDPSSLLAQLDDILERFPSVIRDLGESTELWDHQLVALNDVYAAEAGRARQDSGNGEHWVRVAEACHAATLAWEELYSHWRAAESLLTRGHHNRELAASTVRKGLDLAEELQAGPILAALEELAVSARIRVDRVNPNLGQESRVAIEGLTVREREILSHVVAGRTYGEIAHALVISEKTVSSHVSNLLRKTGTTNRVDLSRLAMGAHSGSERP
jgi:DNA-binding CsgD family transcriptional regulator